MASWLCDDSESPPTNQVTLSMIVTEGLTAAISDESLGDLADVLNEITDTLASDMAFSVISLAKSSTQVNVTIYFTAEAIAEAAAEELTSVLGTATAATYELALPITQDPVIFEEAVPDFITTVWLLADDENLDDSISHWRGNAVAASANRRAAKLRRAVAVARTRAREGRSEQAAAHSVQPLSSAPPPLPPLQPPNSTVSDDYYSLMRSIASLHLVWLLPIIGFLLLTCCCIWWCVSEHRMHEEEQEVYVASEEHMRRNSAVGREAFLNVIGDEEIEEVSTRVMLQRADKSRRFTDQRDVLKEA
jgi:hypothetical protein